VATALAQFGRQVRDRRRALGLTQQALARELNVLQSQISAVERGRAGALGKGNLIKLAERLGLSPEPMLEEQERATCITAYCPNADCPQNTPYALGGEVALKPRLVQRNISRWPFCEFCGERYISVCPGCNNPVGDDGAFCTRCGTALVQAIEAPSGVSLREWLLNEQMERRQVVIGVRVGKKSD
jgi:transcriptional regulator with XRE-family HTH domain